MEMIANSIELKPIISPSAKIYNRVLKLMGNRFEISVVANTQPRADYYIDAGVAEIRRIERLFTTFSDDSQTNLINRNAGIEPVAVDTEVFDLIDRSIKISELTQGAFDITYGSIDKRFWNFDTTMTTLPAREIAKQAVRLVNYKNVILDRNNHSVLLKEKGMRIGFGGIGKGYAAEMAKRVMKEEGAIAGIVNASGDLCTWGRPPEKTCWTIGIADPNLEQHIFSCLDISNMAIATSGSYEKYVIVDGKKYSHTINPKTGYPVSGIKSTTIICPNAELADALATPVTVMGTKVGLDLINQMKNIACIIIDDDNRIHTSSNIQLS